MAFDTELLRATHAGSWYTSNAEELDEELSDNLNNARPTEEHTFTFPVKGVKAIIAPHAGYSYSGPAAAWAYKAIDTTGIKRVFILGPSHHVYVDGCQLTKCNEYATPLGSLPVDKETVAELRQTGAFSDMSLKTDEDEHSIEMHLSYVRKVFEGLDIKIVPILVGAINSSSEARYGALLAPFLQRSDTLCVVSSDFCHWGTRFSFTHYYTSPPTSINAGVALTKSNAASSISPTFPIYSSIEALDRQALNILSVPPNSAAKAQSDFIAYLKTTENTICGRHPIGVLLGALVEIEKSKEGKDIKLEWVRYEQSSQCEHVRDSSVSYASAYAVF
ncbi:UPF0103-domain-containing protein [Schizopora paradoxa]|uniref:UPF0103-domain-containing protein n=1 Tax=Schizopora paradoxa TaxID=27342 RepID=A0A0H2RRH7_9AGAM|nr:UPF0103-domain-containing protein [Schizopora paradoxa]